MTMLVTRIHTPPRRKAKNPTGVKAAIPITSALHPSHAGRAP
jgi:hypothetical protein